MLTLATMRRRRDPPWLCRPRYRPGPGAAGRRTARPRSLLGQPASEPEDLGLLCLELGFGEDSLLLQRRQALKLSDAVVGGRRSGRGGLLGGGRLRCRRLHGGLLLLLLIGGRVGRLLGLGLRVLGPTTDHGGGGAGDAGSAGRRTEQTGTADTGHGTSEHGRFSLSTLAGGGQRLLHGLGVDAVVGDEMTARIGDGGDQPTGPGVLPHAEGG